MVNRVHKVLQVLLVMKVQREKPDRLEYLVLLGSKVPLDRPVLLVSRVLLGNQPLIP
jgi:hypothetical protein